ncbi:ketol-acid reductoisomerase [Vulcanisaeta thermophila]|uniref:ketol-acid reductoisomerase n=1 Tax=Vulcanisaeta thermophila TaxID=867917 RepID=UPI00085382C6|nr:ketol-acid reductoisomerase [Vulcanisaeta thermophila]
MARLFFDGDASLIKDRVIAMIGFGNQGSAQAMNLRDGGFRVVVGNIEDEYARRAKDAGFEVVPIPEAVRRGDVVVMAIPDEVQPEVWVRDIQPNLRDGDVVVFLSGYNVYYGFIKPPTNCDVIMVAPRMIGEGVRDNFVNGRGFPVLIGVANNYSGRAWDYALAYSKAIGAIGRPGGVAVESSFEEETVTDLFSEHTWAGAFLFMLAEGYRILVENGVSPEAAILELWASGELIAIAKAIMEKGLFAQLRGHSTTSQYGHLTWGPRYITDEVRRLMRQAVKEIKDGTFAREWALERMLGYPVFNRLWDEVMKSDVWRDEDKLYRALGRRK